MRQVQAMARPIERRVKTVGVKFKKY